MTDRETERNKAKGKGSTAAALIFALALGAVLLYGSITAPISGGTERLMSDTAGTIDEIGAVDTGTLYPISSDTKKLLSKGIMVLQNPAYMTEGEKETEPVDIEAEDQDKIVKAISREWPEDAPPWSTGYEGRCENWVCDVYHEAGLPTRGSCCAARSRDRLALSTDDIPVGAMVYSDSGYRSGKICEICGRDPGHVAIYIGSGMVAGSQSEYIMTVEAFEDMFGIGGWSFSGNLYG